MGLGCGPVPCIVEPKAHSCVALDLVVSLAPLAPALSRPRRDAVHLVALRAEDDGPAVNGGPASRVGGGLMHTTALLDALGLYQENLTAILVVEEFAPPFIAICLKDLEDTARLMVA